MSPAGTETTSAGRPPSLDALSATSRSAHTTLDHIANLVRGHAEQIAQTVACSPECHATECLDTSIRQAGSGIAAAVDEANQQITSAITAEIDALESTLRKPAPVSVQATVPVAVIQSPPDGCARSTRDALQPPPLPPLDDIAASRGTREWAAAVVERYPILTVDEVLAIYGYTGMDLVEINRHLRNPESTPKADRKAIEKRIEKIISGLSKLPKYQGVTYRKTYLPPAVLRQWQPGKVIHDQAFLSTCADEVMVEKFERKKANVLLTITGQGWSGVDIRKLAVYGSEAEILFPPAADVHLLTRDWDKEWKRWAMEGFELAA